MTGTSGTEAAASGSGPIVAATVPGQSARVLKEAARQAKAFHTPLVVVHVDTSRFVEGVDPDGWSGAPASAEAATELDEVRAAASALLDGHGVDWSVHQLVGDPALALKHFGESVDARLFVVGTRRRGFGESMREFLTGSVAARLTHRQRRPVLVVPLGEPLADDEDPAWTD